MLPEKMFAVYDAGDFERLFLTQEAAQTYIDTFTPDERIHKSVEPLPVTYPLDPAPWHHYTRDERATTPTEAPSLRGWRFKPRPGFTKATGAYSEQGGLDPLPWLTPIPEGMPEGTQIKGHDRWATFKEGYRTRNIFLPREGFMQDPLAYGLNLDPKPWLHGFRRADQVTGALLEPRPEYNQERDLYYAIEAGKKYHR